MTGLDAAKSVFHVRGVDETGKVESGASCEGAFFEKQETCIVVMEARGAAQSPSQNGGNPAASGRSFGMLRRQWGCQETHPFPPCCDGLCAPPLDRGYHSVTEIRHGPFPDLRAEGRA
jgi:hypothetical protein